MAIWSCYASVCACSQARSPDKPSHVTAQARSRAHPSHCLAHRHSLGDDLAVVTQVCISGDLVVYGNSRGQVVCLDWRSSRVTDLSTQSASPVRSLALVGACASPARSLALVLPALFMRDPTHDSSYDVAVWGTIVSAFNAHRSL